MYLCTYTVIENGIQVLTDIKTQTYKVYDLHKWIVPQFYTWVDFYITQSDVLLYNLYGIFTRLVCFLRVRRLHMLEI